MLRSMAQAIVGLPPPSNHTHSPIAAAQRASIAPHRFNRICHRAIVGLQAPCDRTHSSIAPYRFSHIC
jgi:hypothetical protein